MWTQNVRDALKYSVSSGRSPFVDRVARPRNFYDLVRWVEGVGENYRRFQNLECRDMKNAVLNLTDGPGLYMIFFASSCHLRRSSIAARMVA